MQASGKTMKKAAASAPLLRLRFPVTLPRDQRIAFLSRPGQSKTLHTQMVRASKGMANTKRVVRVRGLTTSRPRKTFANSDDKSLVAQNIQ